MRSVCEENGWDTRKKAYVFPSVSKRIRGEPCRRSRLLEGAVEYSAYLSNRPLSLVDPLPKHVFPRFRRVSSDAQIAHPTLPVDTVRGRPLQNPACRPLDRNETFAPIVFPFYKKYKIQRNRMFCALYACFICLSVILDNKPSNKPVSTTYTDLKYVISDRRETYFC